MEVVFNRHALKKEKGLWQSAFVKGIWPPFKRERKHDMNALLLGTKSESFLEFLLSVQFKLTCTAVYF